MCGIFGFGMIVFKIMKMFFESDFKGAASLAYVCHVTVWARKAVDAAAI